MDSGVDKASVLFLCMGNACRSQMAEGWARVLHPDRVDAFSAGIAPAGIDPRAVQVMAEAGVDILRQWSKHVDELADTAFDAVITVCDRTNGIYPAFPARARRLHAGFDDPPQLARGTRSEEEALEHYRRVRDEIRRYVQTLPEILDEGGGREQGDEP